MSESEKEEAEARDRLREKEAEAQEALEEAEELQKSAPDVPKPDDEAQAES